VTVPIAGSSHTPRYFGIDQLNPISPRPDVEVPGFPEIEQQCPGTVQQRECAQRTLWGNQVEIEHAAPEQRVSLTEVVVNVEA
jgi:hypothetical protein